MRSAPRHPSFRCLRPRPTSRLLVACALLGCAEPLRGPFFGDDKLLRYGVDPHAEAAELTRAFERAGHVLRGRLPGEHFTALSFDRPEGSPSAVRVVTRRGIVVALDSEPGDGLRPQVQVWLLPRPIEGTHDADGDGFEEVFAVRRVGPHSCVFIYRVRDVGFVDPVVPDLAWLGDDACIERVADRDGDGKVELLTTWTLTGVPLPVQPTVSVALFPVDHRYEPVAPPGYYTDELALAELALTEAQETGRADLIYEAGLKLAAVHWLFGATVADQIAQLERAFAMVPGALREPAVERGLRDRVERGLRDAPADEGSGGDPETGDPETGGPKTGDPETGTPGPSEGPDPAGAKGAPEPGNGPAPQRT